MGNCKCCDCAKIIETDKQLCFFVNEESAVQVEGYLCEACADQRIKEWYHDSTKVTAKEAVVLEETLAGYDRGEYVTLKELKNEIETEENKK